MATVINGTDIHVFLNDVWVAHETSHSLSSKMTARITSNKDSGKFNSKAPGRLDISGSFECLKVYTDYATLWAAYLARVAVKLDFGERAGETLVDGEYTGGTLDTSKFYQTGNFYIMGIDDAAPDEDNASYTVSIENADASFACSTDTTLRVGIAHSDCTTFGGTEGAAFALPLGGTAPYTYLWDDPAPAQTTQAATALAAGTYTVVVTDAVAATASCSVVINQPAA